MRLFGNIGTDVVYNDFVTFMPSSLGITPGGVTSGGNMTHFLAPLISAFHAEVEFGSL